MHQFLLVAAVAMLAGCVEGPARPSDWQAGIALSAFEGSKTHAAHESYSLYPPHGFPLEPPARCVAYQDGHADRRDSCEVHPEPFVPAYSFQVRRDPWWIEARWDGSGERLHEDVELHPEARTVVAFDADDRPVAWWAGQRAADGQFMTE